MAFAHRSNALERGEHKSEEAGPHGSASWFEPLFPGDDGSPDGWGRRPGQVEEPPEPAQFLKKRGICGPVGRWFPAYPEEETGKSPGFYYIHPSGGGVYFSKEVPEDEKRPCKVPRRGCWKDELKK